MGDILDEIIRKELFIEPLYLKGSLSKKRRDELIDTFNSDKEKKIFILSLKAGGIGLNLTAANNVIHYDLWFNPAVENQATDRAFRIGQEKNVNVFRFITQNSFEEKIDKMIKAKQQLQDLSVSVGEKWIGKMSDTELKTLFEV
jgi:SNF2 family DNA or RNA helicase